MSKGKIQPPSTWSVKFLSEIADVIVSNVDKKSVPGEQPVRLCNYIDVYNNENITPNLSFMEATASQAEIAKFRLRSGDVIITKDSETPNDIGVPSVMRADMDQLVCGYHLSIIRLKSQDNDPVFLARQLNSARIVSYFGRQANGTTRYGLGIDSVGDTEIWLASSDEQRRIALILDTADAAIAKTETLIAKLKQMKTGLLKDLLTRGVDENGELRNADNKSQFQDTRIGRIPKVWNVKDLNDLVSQERPICYGILMPGYGFHGGVPVIKVKDIKDGAVDTTDLLLTSPTIDAAYSRSRTVPGDLLFTIRGTVGRMAFVPSTLPVANITQDTARVGVVKANPQFVERYLSTPVAKAFVDTHIVGVAVKGINLRDVRRIPIGLPPREEQDLIVNASTSLDRRIEDEVNSVKKIKQLKSALMNDLLTGRKLALTTVVTIN
jgi:type I restriction enzyme S subunit